MLVAVTSASPYGTLWAVSRRSPATAPAGAGSSVSASPAAPEDALLDTEIVRSFGRRKKPAAVALFPRMRLSNGIPATALVALALLAPSTSLAQIDPGLSVAAGNSWETRQMSPFSCAGAACQLGATVDPMAPVTFAPLAPSTSP